MNVEPGSWPRQHRISVDDYRRMAEIQLFGADERVELIEGEVVDMPPIGSRHAVAVTVLAERLASVCGASTHVRVQQPLRLGSISEPQPDVALAKGRPRRYNDEHPGPDDVLLVVEVADATLRFDLEVKARLYAAHGVGEYWVVDLVHRHLHVFRRPQGGAYEHCETLAAGVASADSAGFEIDVAELF